MPNIVNALNATELYILKCFIVNIHFTSINFQELTNANNPGEQENIPPPTPNFQKRRQYTVILAVGKSDLQSNDEMFPHDSHNLPNFSCEQQGERRTLDS